MNKRKVHMTRSYNKKSKLSIKFCNQVYGIIIYSAFMSIVDIWSLERAFENTVRVSSDEVQFVLNYHISLFIKNNNMCHLRSLLFHYRTRCFLTGGAIVQLIHGNVQKMTTYDLDVYFQTCLNYKYHGVLIRKMLTKYGGFLYTKRKLYEIIVSLQQVHKVCDWVWKKLEKHATSEYNSIVMLSRDIYDIMSDPNDMLSTYTDIIMSEKSCRAYVDTFDISVCMVQIYLNSNGLWQLKVDSQIDHIYKRMTSSCRGNIYNSYFNISPKSIRVKDRQIIQANSHRHLDRVCKYYSRGFRVHNKMELYLFVLWLMDNQMLLNFENRLTLESMMKGCYKLLNNVDFKRQVLV